MAVAADVSAHHVVVHHVAIHHIALGHADEIAAGCRHVVDDGYDDGAGGRIAQRVLHLVGEGFGHGIGAVVGMGRGVRWRGQRIGVGAISIELNLAVLAYGISDQCVRERTDPATG
ncbi:hypothetical protein D3C78_1577580 [compost metagenome]